MILRIYDYMAGHRAVRRMVLLTITVVMAVLASRLTYKEDISDFLPLDGDSRDALSVYQDISGADMLVVTLGAKDAMVSPDTLCDAVDMFCSLVAECDTAGWTSGMTAQVDMEQMEQVREFAYENIPYLLDDADYRRMDSLLSVPDYVGQRLKDDKEILTLPTGGMLAGSIGNDPLALFAPTIERLCQSKGKTEFEIYDGYIFTPDMKRAVITLKSPFGNAETDMNARLTDMLAQVADDVQAAHPVIDVHVIGGPQIAVGNARQIKHDSILAVALSAILVLALLMWSFRSVRNMLLVAVSVAWGAVFALGMMSLLRDSVSIIVIGISSIIAGIAANYPLHLIDHATHEQDMRQALREIKSPLLIGNVTTVGAFAALIPLRSTALCDLGLFASLLLVGTIAFVLVFLPHIVERKALRQIPVGETETLSRFTPRYSLCVLAVLTCVFAYFAMQTEFDSDMSNINYMTDEQKADMEYLQSFGGEGKDKKLKTLYVTATDTTMNGALAKCEGMADGLGDECPTRWIASQAVQERRIAKWRDFVGRHANLLGKELTESAVRNGFSASAFEEFDGLLTKEFKPQPYEYFKPLTSTLLRGNFSIDSVARRYTVVTPLQVKADELPMMRQIHPGSFDVESMNGAMASTLSDNFNYIGLVCSLIVFVFLWFSFRSLKVAVIAFVPMAVSWVWILGIMSILGVKFNIVNIILATFIFGQGDDYTIFVTEGCLYEMRTGKHVLASYKRGIILSALIMLTGIGTLILARHPALHSLAVVTIIGMACVVVMACFIPPLLIRMLKVK